MNTGKNINMVKIFALAVQNHQQNNLEEAKNLYNQILKIDPNHISSLNNLGSILKNSGEKQKAKDCFEKAIEIDPNFLDALTNLGILFDELGQYQKSVECYKKIIEINPNYENTHNNLGAVFLKLKEYEKAKECIKKEIKINPSSVKAHTNLGIFFKKILEYEKAKECFEKAIQINPNFANAVNNLGSIFQLLGENQKAKDCFEKAIEIDPRRNSFIGNLAMVSISILNDFDKAISLSTKAFKINLKNVNFVKESIPLFRLKHDAQQAKYLSSKNYKIDGIDQFLKIGDEILSRKENKEDKDNYNKRIVLTSDEVSALLPFYKSDFTYKPKKISGSHINPNKNWQEVEDEYFNSSNQIMYIDDFLSDEALIELREFCLVSKVWHKEYSNKYLGAIGERGFISHIHLQIAIELKQKLPKLFGPHDLGGYWGFKYDSTLGKGINIHADFALHNLNFWITPDKYNNNKNGGGLKVYDAPAPEHWTFEDYNTRTDKIYEFLKENNANCTNIPHKCNRAVLFNSAYFHETDEIDFKDEYEGRRINNTYLFGRRRVYNNK